MAYQGLRIIDSHAHFPGPERPLGQADTQPGRGAGGAGAEAAARRAETLRRHREAVQARWRRMWGFPAPEAAPRAYEEQARRWVEELDRYGIDRIVFVTNGSNEKLAEVVRRYPNRFVGYASHCPFEPGAARRLEHAVTELGLRGYKLIAPLIDRPIADREAYPVWEAAERLQIPVLIHFGPLGGVGGVASHLNMNPLALHDVAKDFPTIPFIVPHFGCGYPTQLLQLGWACPNVYTDTSGSNEWVRWTFPHATLEDLFRKFLETFGPERVIFGSDSSWFPRGFAEIYLREQLRICYQIGVSEANIARIFSGNIAGLLRLGG